MARPTTARLRTAYDLGVEAAREGGREMPGNISGEPELAAAYDEGFGDETDRQEGTTKTKPPAATPHRATATQPRPAARARAKPSRGSGATRQVSWPTPTLRPSTSDGTGFLFGVLLYCLGLSYIRGGRDGVLDWLRAKFVNKSRDGTPLL